MLLDAHIHLADIQESADREELLSAVRETVFFCNATSPADWGMVDTLAGRFPAVVPFYGVHPWFADGLQEGWEEELRLRLRKGGAIGEIGLDAIKGASLERQKEVLERQLGIACESGRPFTLHCVRAWGDLVGMLHRYRQSLPVFIVHGFGASGEILKELLELGGYISFWLKDLERRPDRLRPLITATPDERILLETDFPNCRYDASQNIVEAYTDCLARAYAAAAALKGGEEMKLKEKVFANGTVFKNAASAR